MDRLSALPPEILHHIFSYLLVNHDPSEGFKVDTGASPPRDNRSTHTLTSVAATSHALRAETDSWARHELIRFEVQWKRPKARNKDFQPPPDTLGYLLDFLTLHCAFCHKRSVRRAILASSLRCCKACEKHFPRKMTKTDARNEFGLRDEDLFAGYGVEDLHFFTKWEGVPAPKGPRRLRYGSFAVAGSVTSMLIREEVEALAETVHGDVAAWKEEREKKRRKREAKREEREEQRRRQEEEEWKLNEGAGRADDTNDVVVID